MSCFFFNNNSYSCESNKTSPSLIWKDLLSGELWVVVLGTHQNSQLWHLSLMITQTLTHGVLFSFSQRVLQHLFCFFLHSTWDFTLTSWLHHLTRVFSSGHEIDTTAGLPKGVILCKRKRSTCYLQKLTEDPGDTALPPPRCSAMNR